MVADGGLQPKDKNERSPEVAEGITRGWRGFSSDAATGGKTTSGPFPGTQLPRGCPSIPDLKAFQEARRAVARTGSVVPSDAAASSPGGCGHAPARRGGFS